MGFTIQNKGVRVCEVEGTASARSWRKEYLECRGEMGGKGKKVEN